MPKIIKNNIKKIEKKVEKYLKKTFPEGIIVKEYGRVNFASRPDYAVFMPDRLIYVEIKGNKDSLARLERQAILYKRIADQVIVILDDKHSDTRAMTLSKEGYGVIRYKNKKLDKKMEYAENTPFLSTDILYLLYADELIMLLRGIESQLNTPLSSMYDRQKVIKAIFTQLEIRFLSYVLLFNRIKAWDKEGRPEKYPRSKLTQDIHYLETKKKMYIDFVNIFGKVENRKIKIN